MAAGQGFKTFVTGEVLTAGDVNGYLMQGINVFTNATARDAAIIAPAEGQFAFTKDNNSLWYYDGAAWVASGATGDIEGVTAGVGISGGGTSGTVTVTNSMATAIDAKGDLVPGTGADTFARLAVGANGTVLTADSAEATGIKWATPAAGTDTWTLLNAGGTTLTGATTITVSGITSSKLFIQVVGASSANSLSYISIRANADTGANYPSSRNSFDYASTVVATDFYNDTDLTANSILLGRMGNSASNTVGGFVSIENCTSTSRKPWVATGGPAAGSGTSARVISGQGFYIGTSAITSVSVNSSTGNFDAGTIYVYGA